MVAIASWMLRHSIKKREVQTDEKENSYLIEDKNKCRESNNRQRHGGIPEHNERIYNNVIRNPLFHNIKSYYELTKDRLLILRQQLLHPSIEYNKLNVDNNNSNSKYYDIVVRGMLVGLVVGYFGIGGGFLIVPALMHSVSGINIVEAVATSLIPVSAFGFVTSLKYALVGQINLFVVAMFIMGGAIGGMVGTKLSYRMPKEKLSKTFAILLIIVAFYMILKTVLHF